MLYFLFTLIGSEFLPSFVSFLFGIFVYGRLDPFNICIMLKECLVQRMYALFTLNLAYWFSMLVMYLQLGCIRNLFYR